MSNSLEQLKELIRRLTGPDGCPWDRVQTPASLTDYILEESRELAWAIHRGQPAEAAEELGDVIFLLLFLAHLYESAGHFNLDQALDLAREKMIRRHPHVFGQTKVTSNEDIFRNWDQIKKKEKEDNKTTADAGLFSSLPRDLEPLLMAYRLNAKAARTGFTWPDRAAVARKLDEEMQEWRQADSSQDADKMEEEFGDVLFTLVELGRRDHIRANTALTRANLKFLGRFEKMEGLAREQGQTLDKMTLEDMNALWDKAKKTD